MATKIMYLLDYYEHPHGGTEGQVLQLIEHLDRSRYEPSLAVLRPSAYIEQNPFPCPVRVLGIGSIGTPWAIAKLLRFAYALRRHGYRIVHCFFNDVSLIAPPLLKAFGIRVLVSRRDLGFWYTPRILAALRATSRFVDRYVANSRAVSRVVQEKERVAEDRISVIYNGFTPARKVGASTGDAGPLGTLGANRIIGIVANLRPIKRMDTLIAAFGAIHADFPDVRVAIVGDHESGQAAGVLEQLVNLANGAGVRDKLIFTGGVADAAPYIERFTVAVLCSESEGFSNALIEYMHAGRPVVCTDAGGNTELVTDEVDGLVVPVGDAGALADRLARLLSDRDLARRLGEAARETIRLNYTHTRMTAEQMACYDAVLSASRPVEVPTRT